ncbi:nucleoside triphosphate pyrophosphohydrolase [Streptomyces sampsonii]|uniref:nucleoside triphosphate pyrophosphohydrolase n=1 Tax=Streptomyces sampsonii TaxID=42239 RepID=UPI00082A677B|nr:nucleoside triphosphate pyrophosphohydrolase [Streptomyces sampsonii]
MNAPSPGRLVLLTTSHRVAPGQLSWPAWQALHQADRVLCADPAHPQLPYLREAGVEVEVAATPDAADLVDFLAGGRTAVLVKSGEGDRRLTDALSRLAGSGRVAMPDLELLPGAYDLPGARLIDLVQVMDRIREECPWSARQTHEELAKYAMEEAFELIEAIEEGDRDALREELGDVLLQVVFHARIAEDGAPATGDDEEDGGPFSVDDVAATLIDKLVRRHPHVFGDAVAETPEEVRAQWLRVKGEEKERTSVTDGVPVAQPALALAAKLASRARGAELRVPLPEGPGPGPALLALAVEAERQGTDPEAALRESARRYREAIRAAEGH